MKILMLCCLALMIFSQEGSAQQISPTFAQVDYTGSGHERHKMDIYIPEGVQQKAPAVLYIHGGAWRGGSKQDALRFCDTLYQQGFVIVGINYRLSQDSIFPAQLYDCKAAVRFLKQHAEKYNIDSSQVGVIGFSAGGHLAALLGTTRNHSSLEGSHLGSNGFSSQVQAVMDVFGPTDFLQMDAHIPPACTGSQRHNTEDSPESQLIGCPIQRCPDKVTQANPITYVDGDEPAFAIHHGLADCIVPAHQGQLLYDALKMKGNDASIQLHEEIGHGGAYWLSSDFKKSIVDFFVKYLRN